MTTKRRLVRAAIAVAGATMLLGIAPTTASAATPRNGVCEVGEICFYWFIDRQESLSDFTSSLDNYGSSLPSCYVFKSDGLGQGDCMKNNAMSAWNRSSRIVRVYFNSYYGGPYDNVAAGTWRNLNVTSNENASHKFLL
ncbi:MAG TPA: peptidase inhibitor family I36 protein [Actinophytocola sp.]|uniref:peptidase inhibitor family I36 protein n=1 Tax=Actinophytocola sp. TaxID=1872138 RepID=UPI002DDD991F|nr:peptidase inhibitor family I36 protein [Actinophytocola sp.]HEV2783422.1 peptidase inhibitor family I36 protein [Actinophytocola sp.]